MKRDVWLTRKEVIARLNPLAEHLEITNDVVKITRSIPGRRSSYFFNEGKMLDDSVDRIERSVHEDMYV